MRCPPLVLAQLAYTGEGRAVSLSLPAFAGLNGAEAECTALGTGAETVVAAGEGPAHSAVLWW